MHISAQHIMELYERHARAWDMERRSGHARSGIMEKSWLDLFASLLPPGGTVLDMGCGAGDPIARYLIKAGYAVTGIDSSPSMISLCRGRFPTARWLTADMRDLALDEIFQGILAWDSFFHLCPDDQRRMFPVFSAHAGAGTALLFTSGPFFGERIGSYGGEDLYHASLDAEEYKTLLAENGFTVVRHTVEDPSCGGHTVWLAQKHP